METLNLKIEGMDCADCALKLEKGVSGLDGVRTASVNFVTAQMEILYDAGTVDRQAIGRRVRALGYGVGNEAGGSAAQGPAAPAPQLAAFLSSHPRERATVLAGLLLLAAFVLDLARAPAAMSSGVYVLATLAGGALIARKGLTNLWINRELDINFLMTLAAAGALIIGELQEGALVIFLFSLGETLEAYTVDQARSSIRSLMSLAPVEATRLSGCLDCAEHLGQGGYTGGVCPFCDLHETRVPVAELQVGDTILVRAGERIAMDGRVMAGESAVNQAPITGESLPVDKQRGDEVFAGTVNGSGALEVRVTHLVQDNTLSRLIHLVEKAQGQKAPSQRWVDRFARVYTPAVVAGAALIAVLPPLLWGQPFWNGADGSHGWLYRALTMLVIACPCALVISTPVSIVSAISQAARRGILIKGGVYLETAARLRAFAFDKTGTLTQGEPRVTDVFVDPQAGLTPAALLALAASVESRSEHPLARAIVDEATVRGGQVVPVLDFQALAGRGARGRRQGDMILVGSQGLFVEAGQTVPAVLQAQVDALENMGKTVMLVGRDAAGAQPLGLIAVADTIRPIARAAVAALKRAGVEHTRMLTGDNARTAAAVAAQAGVDDVAAGLSPAAKVAAVEDLAATYGTVAMVGDGVNDAPALARAGVGIAMGAAGTDQALETADIVLLADDLSRLPEILSLSRRTRQVVRQNILFSLAVKAIFMALALGGVATLWMAVFADMGASLLVIGNGMRLLRR